MARIAPLIIPSKNNLKYTLYKTMSQSQWGKLTKMKCSDLNDKNNNWYINHEYHNGLRSAASYNNLINIANHFLKKWGLGDGYVHKVLNMVGNTPDGLIQFMIGFTQANHPYGGWLGVINCQTDQVYGDIYTHN